MDIDVADEVRACAEALGSRPRRFSLWDRMTYLGITRPTWVLVHSDPLQTFFKHHQRVLKSGRVTWGSVIQANASMFESGWSDAPGEVVYGMSESGPAARDELAAVAARLFELKGSLQQDPMFGFLSHYLANELVRVFGHPVPTLLSPRFECMISTVWMPRKHLPGGRLRKPEFPLLVSDAAPHVAMIVPERYWSPALRAWWLSGE